MGAEVLVLMRPNELKEKWDGRRLRADEARKISGIETIVWQMSAHWINGLAIALCPAGIFFWSAEMEGFTGFLWFVTLVVCVTNFLLWAICACVISAAVQKLLQLSHRQAN